jgi:hypothetical protein
MLSVDESPMQRPKKKGAPLAPEPLDGRGIAGYVPEPELCGRSLETDHIAIDTARSRHDSPAAVADILQRNPKFRRMVHQPKLAECRSLTAPHLIGVDHVQW